MPLTRSLLLAQMTPRVGDVSHNLTAVAQLLAEHGDADLAIFPELYLGGYSTQNLAHQAVSADASTIAELSDLAAHHATALILGFAEQRNGGIANSALCIDRTGRVQGIYRKAQLFGDEAEAFEAGDALTVVELDGVRVGLMICFDLEFPEIARQLARAGAELLVAISANMVPFANDHRVFAQARAIENGLPLVYVNQVGEGERFHFTGGSCVVTADGSLTALSDSKPEVRAIELSITGSNSDRPDYLRALREPLPPVATGADV